MVARNRHSLTLSYHTHGNFNRTKCLITLIGSWHDNGISITHCHDAFPAPSCHVSTRAYDNSHETLETHETSFPTHDNPHLSPAKVLAHGPTIGFYLPPGASPWERHNDAGLVAKVHLHLLIPDDPANVIVVVDIGGGAPTAPSVQTVNVIVVIPHEHEAPAPSTLHILLLVIIRTITATDIDRDLVFIIGVVARGGLPPAIAPNSSTLAGSQQTVVVLPTAATYRSILTPAISAATPAANMTPPISTFPRGHRSPFSMVRLVLALPVIDGQVQGGQRTGPLRLPDRTVPGFQGVRIGRRVRSEHPFVLLPTCGRLAGGVV